MHFNKWVRKCVGTDSSRPLGLFTRRQGRDESVPTHFRKILSKHSIFAIQV